MGGTKRFSSTLPTLITKTQIILNLFEFRTGKPVDIVLFRALAAGIYTYYIKTVYLVVTWQTAWQCSKEEKSLTQAFGPKMNREPSNSTLMLNI